MVGHCTLTRRNDRTQASIREARSTTNHGLLARRCNDLVLSSASPIQASVDVLLPCLKPFKEPKLSLPDLVATQVLKESLEQYFKASEVALEGIYLAVQPHLDRVPCLNECRQLMTLDRLCLVTTMGPCQELVQEGRKGTSGSRMKMARWKLMCMMEQEVQSERS